MAVEGRIDADDDWFVGEDRTLRFQFVEGDTTDIDLWNIEFQLFTARAAPSAAPLITAIATATPRSIVGPAMATVVVDGADTLAHGPGNYQYVLSRVDPGARAVLAFGPAQIRSAVRP